MGQSRRDKARRKREEVRRKLAQSEAGTQRSDNDGSFSSTSVVTAHQDGVEGADAHKPSTEGEAISTDTASSTTDKAANDGTSVSDGRIIVGGSAATGDSTLVSRLAHLVSEIEKKNHASLGVVALRGPRGLADINVLIDPAFFSLERTTSARIRPREDPASWLAMEPGLTLIAYAARLRADKCVQQLLFAGADATTRWPGGGCDGRDDCGGSPDLPRRVRSMLEEFPATYAVWVVSEVVHMRELGVERYAPPPPPPPSPPSPRAQRECTSCHGDGTMSNHHDDASIDKLTFSGDSRPTPAVQGASSVASQSLGGHTSVDREGVVSMQDADPSSSTTAVHALPLLFLCTIIQLFFPHIIATSLSLSVDSIDFAGTCSSRCKAPCRR